MEYYESGTAFAVPLLCGVYFKFQFVALFPKAPLEGSWPGNAGTEG